MMGLGEMRTRLQEWPHYEILGSAEPKATPLKERIATRIVFVLQIGLFIASIGFFIMLFKSFAWAAMASCINAAAVDKRQGTSDTSSVPQYFQTTPMLYPG